MTETASGIFVVFGTPLDFQLQLITDAELRNDLQGQIESLGGKVVGQDEYASLYLVDTLTDPVVFRGVNALLAIPSIVLKWDWVIECYDRGSIIGPLEDWGGFRLQDSRPIPSSYSGPAPVLQNEEVNHQVSTPEPVASFQMNHYATQSTASDSSVCSFTMRAASSSSTSETDSHAVDRSSPLMSHSSSKKNGKRRLDTSPPASKKRRISSPTESSTSHGLGESRASSRTTVSRSITGNTPPPTPPRNVVASEWFGNDYTDEDYHFLRGYVAWVCEHQHDPDFSEMFKEMGARAPHHSAHGWRHFYHKHEFEIVRDVPALRRLYEESSDDDSDDTQWKSRPSKPLNLTRPKQLNLIAVGKTTVDVPDADKRALIHFMAEAPEGVTQADLLQNFAHYYPSKSWRTWQSLIRTNKDSFDRAVAKRRESLQGM